MSRRNIRVILNHQSSA